MPPSTTSSTIFHYVWTGVLYCIFVVYVTATVSCNGAIKLAFERINLLKHAHCNQQSDHELQTSPPVFIIEQYLFRILTVMSVVIHCHLGTHTTSTTKPEVSQCHQRRIEPRPQATCTTICGTSAVWFMSYVSGKTNRHTHHNTSNPSWGKLIIHHHHHHHHQCIISLQLRNIIHCCHQYRSASFNRTWYSLANHSLTSLHNNFF